MTHHNKTSNAPFVHTYDLDQLGHPPFNIIKTIVRYSLHTQGLKTVLCGQQKAWSHLVETYADLSLHWEYIPYCWFPYGAAPYFYECSPIVHMIKIRPVLIVEYVKYEINDLV